ncbi:MAG: hypothetical protein AAB365_03910 [Patescibacteria group bacterium]
MKTCKKRKTVLNRTSSARGNIPRPATPEMLAKLWHGVSPKKLRGKRANPNLGGAEQEAVMAHYKEKGWIRFPDEQRALHMFFSPHTVPKGLTARQVQECLELFHLREWQRARRARLASYRSISVQILVAGNPTALPKEFLPVKWMNPWRFRKAVRKFKAHMMIELAQASI